MREDLSLMTKTWCNICKQEILSSISQPRRHCNICGKCVIRWYIHCGDCRTCVPSTFKHCFECKTCVPNGSSHCYQCGGCYSYYIDHKCS